jgi:hypothetical protein
MRWSGGVGGGGTSEMGKIGKMGEMREGERERRSVRGLLCALLRARPICGIHGRSMMMMMIGGQ